MENVFFLKKALDRSDIFVKTNSSDATNRHGKNEMTKQITHLLTTYGAEIFSGGIPGLRFGGMFNPDTIARMAEDEGLDTWISCLGNWVIESKHIEGSFILVERKGEIYLEAANGEGHNG